MKPSPTMMKQTVSVERRMESVDAAGSPTHTWASHLSGLRASVQPGSSDEARRVGAEREAVTYDVYLDHGHDVTAGDRIPYDGGYLELAPGLDQAGRGVVTHFVGVRKGGING